MNIQCSAFIKSLKLKNLKIVMRNPELFFIYQLVYDKENLIIFQAFQNVDFMDFGVSNFILVFQKSHR
jgi:hypothetical protein